MDDLRPIIYLVGIGMGGEDQLTGRTMDCLEAARVVVGADRMLDGVGAYADKKRIFSVYKSSEMVRQLDSFRWSEAALVLSGDTSFHSGAEAAVKAFVRGGWDMKFTPGVPSLSCFYVRLGKNQQNVHPVSSRGQDHDVVAHIRGFRNCFILLGGAGGVPDLCRQLVSSEMNSVTIWAGGNSSYEDEHIAWEMTPAELLVESERSPFGSLTCVLVENTKAAEGQLYPQPGPGGDDHIRGQAPMTKKEVRGVSLKKLCIDAQAVCYDIGASTDSVAVEMGMEVHKRGSSGQVYITEQNQEALQLIESNCQKFHGGWIGFRIAGGGAPKAMEGLEPPTHTFIGGSGGHMREIMAALLDANPHVRIMVNVITLETMGEILACMKEFEFATGEVTQIQAAPMDTVGSCRMPKTQNPVYVAVMQDPKGDGGEIQWQEL